jgi:maltose alpha-D-glucosyltransferase/alpha-amylase
LLTGEQSNTSVMFEDRFIMKLYRKLGEGVNPDLEIGRFLTDEAGFTNTAPVAGALEYSTRRNAPPATVAVLQGFVSNGGDAWSYTLDALGRFFEWALAHPEIDPANYSAGSILTGNELDEYPEMVQNSIGFYMLTARLLGERTAEMHMALASKRDNPAFAPEPFTDLWRRSLYQSMRNHTNEVLRTLRGQRARLPEDLIEAANQVVASEDEILERFRPILDMRITGMRTRIHGDYHLGQLLHTGNDFVIIDFEGEPARSISERRLKRSPLRDVAGMLRSFHYAANAAMYGQANTIIRPDDLPMLTKWADFWYRWVSVGFMSGYLATASDSAFLPKSKEELRALMEIYLLEKSIYEINYEMNNRPGWVGVPLSGILHLLGKSQ